VKFSLTNRSSALDCREQCQQLRAYARQKDSSNVIELSHGVCRGAAVDKATAQHSAHQTSGNREHPRFRSRSIRATYCLRGSARELGLRLAHATGLSIVSSLKQSETVHPREHAAAMLTAPHGVSYKSRDPRETDQRPSTDVRLGPNLRGKLRRGRSRYWSD
jgi:hypothetical protein